MSYYKQQDAFGSAKWWLTAGCCGFLVTISFVGAILWLGVNVRQTETTFVQDRQRFQRKPVPHFRDLQPENEEEQEEGEEDAVMSPAVDVIPSTPSPSTLPPSPTPMRTFKPFVSSRGRIEMIRPSAIGHATGDKQQSEAPTRIRLPLPQPPRHKQHPRVEDHPQDIQFTEERRVGGELQSSPDYTSSLEDAFGGIFVSGEASSKKKSEAVYPHWFGEDLNAARSSIVEGPENRVIQEEMEYDTQSSSEPEIPEFIYLKDVNYSNSAEEPVEMTRISRNPMLMFLRRRVQDLYDWLSAGGKVRSDDEWLNLLRAVNKSINDGNFTSVVKHLKRMYNETTSAAGLDELPVDSLIYGGANGSMNPVSFGLLAVDLFLLHNVQQIAWNEESGLGEKMMNDPDVVAMNALFLPSDRLHRLRSEGSRLLTEPERGSSQRQGFMDELLELLTGGLRAVLNLSRAYKSSIKPRSSNAASPLDCVWTLYCRNLEKTARLHGPYGFLAKINRLGLRLLMGEFPVENALENLVKEATQGWQAIHCEKLFPRCGDEAKDVVLETVMRGSSTKQ